MKTIGITIFLLLCAMPSLAATETPRQDSLTLVKELAEAKIDRPHNGMTMEAVLKKYGEPKKKHAPVGDPPITRWDYPDFNVYFEYNRVIHAVPNRK